MHGFKRMVVQVMVRTFERSVTELHVRIALLNRVTQLGRPTTFEKPAMLYMRRGPSPLSRFGFCNRAAPKVDD